MGRETLNNQSVLHKPEKQEFGTEVRKTSIIFTETDKYYH